MRIHLEAPRLGTHPRAAEQFSRVDRSAETERKATKKYTRRKSDEPGRAGRQLDLPAGCASLYDGLWATGETAAGHLRHRPSGRRSPKPPAPGCAGFRKCENQLHRGCLASSKIRSALLFSQRESTTHYGDAQLKMTVKRFVVSREITAKWALLCPWQQKPHTSSMQLPM